MFFRFFGVFFSHQKTLNTSHVENIEANVKQNGLKPSLKHTDSEYIWFDICIFATSRVIRTQTDRMLISQQVATIHMSNHIYSESAWLGAGFKTGYELQYSIICT